jgi:hypothetical protein
MISSSQNLRNFRGFNSLILRCNQKSLCDELSATEPARALQFLDEARRLKLARPRIGRAKGVAPIAEAPNGLRPLVSIPYIADFSTRPVPHPRRPARPFDQLLGNGNQAPQGFQVQAGLTPDCSRLRVVMAVFPAWSTAALKTLWRLRAVTLVDFRPPTPHWHPTPFLVSAPSSNRAWALTATAQPAKTPREQ